MTSQSQWALLRLAIVGATAFLFSSNFASAQFGPAKVTVTDVVERGDIASGRAFVGTVEARRHSMVGSAVAGRVVEFLVNDGDRVEKGQPLAKLLTRNLQIQIAAATAEWELRKQELLELKNGSRVEEIEQAEARMKAAEATARYAKTKLARTKELVGQKATTRDQIEEDTSMSEVTADTARAAKAGYDLVVAGTRPEKIAQADARAAAAKEEINRLEDILEKHTITAPFAGYVVAEHTEVGQWIESGKLVAEIVEVDPIEVRVHVQESYIPRLTLGVSARVDIDALPNQTFIGSVIAIVPKADEKSRTFPVRIALKNPRQSDGTPLLKPGMFAKVELPVDQKKNVRLVPKDSLVLGGPQPVVYIVIPGEKPTVQPVPVQLGIAVGSWIEVKGDLKSGQQVVVEGNERLRPGAEIVAAEAEIKPPSAERTKPNKEREATKSQ